MHLIPKPRFAGRQLFIECGFGHVQVAHNLLNHLIWSSRIAKTAKRIEDWPKISQEFRALTFVAANSILVLVSPAFA